MLSGEGSREEKMIKRMSAVEAGPGSHRGSLADDHKSAPGRVRNVSEPKSPLTPAGTARRARSTRPAGGGSAGEPGRRNVVARAVHGQ